MPAFQGMVSVVAFPNSPRMKTKLSFVYKDFVQYKKLLIAWCLLCLASVNWPFTDVLLSACSPSACHSLMRPLQYAPSESIEDHGNLIKPGGKVSD